MQCKLDVHIAPCDSCGGEPTFSYEGPYGPWTWRYMLHCEACADVDGPPSEWSEDSLLSATQSWNELQEMMSDM